MNKKITTGYIIVSIIGLLLLAILQIWANNTLASYGAKLEEISVLENQLRLDNQVIEVKIAQLSSLTHIASKSAELGFVPIVKVEYIK